MLPLIQPANLTYRQVGPDPTNTAQGVLTGNQQSFLNFTMAVHPTNITYFTVKLYGSDMQTGLLYLYFPLNITGAQYSSYTEMMSMGGGMYQLGSFIGEDIAPGDQATSMWELDLVDGRTVGTANPREFVYSTTALPLYLTLGQTSLSFLLGGFSSASGYQAPTYNTLTTYLRPVYTAYTHTQSSFIPPLYDARTAPPPRAPAFPLLSPANQVIPTAQLQNNISAIQALMDSQFNSSVLPGQIWGSAWNASLTTNGGTVPYYLWGAPITIGSLLSTSVFSSLQWPAEVQSNMIPYHPNALAAYYLTPWSQFYQSPDVFNRIIAGIDFFTVQQGSNGGFQSNSNTPPWCGAPNRTAACGGIIDGDMPYRLALAVMMMLPTLQTSGVLNTMVDPNLTGQPTVTRAVAWATMFNNSQWGTLSRRGHAPNQDSYQLEGIMLCNQAATALLQLSSPPMPYAQMQAYIDQAIGFSPAVVTPSEGDFYTQSGWVMEGAGTLGGGGMDFNYGYANHYLLTQIVVASIGMGLSNASVYTQRLFNLTQHIGRYVYTTYQENSTTLYPASLSTLVSRFPLTLNTRITHSPDDPVELNYVPCWYLASVFKNPTCLRFIQLQLLQNNWPGAYINDAITNDGEDVADGAAQTMYFLPYFFDVVNNLYNSSYTTSFLLPSETAYIDSANHTYGAPDNVEVDWESGAVQIMHNAELLYLNFNKRHPPLGVTGYVQAMWRNSNFTVYANVEMCTNTGFFGVYCVQWQQYHIAVNRDPSNNYTFSEMCWSGSSYWAAGYLAYDMVSGSTWNLSSSTSFTLAPLQSVVLIPLHPPNPLPPPTGIVCSSPPSSGWLVAYNITTVPQAVTYLPLVSNMSDPTNSAVFAAYPSMGGCSGSFTSGTLPNGQQASYWNNVCPWGNGILTNVYPALSFTISLWVLPQVTASWTDMLLFGSADTMGAGSVDFRWNNGTSGNAPVQQLTYLNGVAQGWHHTYPSSPIMQTWTMITYVVNSFTNQSFIYINATLQNTFTSSSWGSVPSAPFTLGGGYGFTSSPFLGGLYNVRVYNVSLAAYDISALLLQDLGIPLSSSSSSSGAVQLSSSSSSSSPLIGYTSSPAGYTSSSSSSATVYYGVNEYFPLAANYSGVLNPATTVASPTMVSTTSGCTSGFVSGNGPSGQPSSYYNNPCQTANEGIATNINPVASFSLSLWFLINTSSYAAENMYLIGAQSSNTSNAVQIYLTYSTPFLYVRVVLNNVVQSITTPLSGSIPTTWNMLTLSHNASSQTYVMYLNGSQASPSFSSSSSAWVNLTAYQPYVIGGFLDGAPVSWVGGLSNVRFFNYTLPSSSVNSFFLQDSMITPITSSTLPLVTNYSDPSNPGVYSSLYIPVPTSCVPSFVAGSLPSGIVGTYFDIPCGTTTDQGITTNVYSSPSFSVSMWLLPNASVWSQMYIVGSQYSKVTKAGAISLSFVYASNTSIEVQFSMNSVSVMINSYYAASFFSYWTLITLVHNATSQTVSLYTNSTLTKGPYSTSSTGWTSLPAYDTYMLGGSADSYEYSWTGGIYNARMYNFSLSADQIDALFVQDLGVPPLSSSSSTVVVSSSSPSVSSSAYSSSPQVSSSTSFVFLSSSSSSSSSSYSSSFSTSSSAVVPDFYSNAFLPLATNYSDVVSPTTSVAFPNNVGTTSACAVGFAMGNGPSGQPGSYYTNPCQTTNQGVVTNINPGANFAVSVWFLVNTSSYASENMYLIGPASNNASGAVQLYLFYRAPIVYVQVTLNNVGQSATAQLFGSLSSFWNMITLTHNASSQTYVVYLNGSQATLAFSSTSAAWNNLTVYQPYVIGGALNGAAVSWVGGLSNARFFNYTLPISTAWSLYLQDSMVTPVTTSTMSLLTNYSDPTNQAVYGLLYVLNPSLCVPSFASGPLPSGSVGTYFDNPCGAIVNQGIATNVYPSPSFSVSMWLLPNVTTWTQMYIVGSLYSRVTGAGALSLSLSYSSNVTIHVSITLNGVSIASGVTFASTLFSYWTLITLVHNATSQLATLYTNATVTNVPFSTASTRWTSLAAYSTYMIGGSANNHAYSWVGGIHNVRMLNYTLTASAIQAFINEDV
jgi:hypothetical protein